MKKILLLLMFLPLLSTAQKLKKNESGMFACDTVISIDSAKAQVIYAHIKSWAATKFKNTEKVTVADLKDSELTFRYIASIKSNGVPVDHYFSYNVKIKDGKIKTSLFGISDVKYGTSIESAYCKKDGTLRDNNVVKKSISQIEQQAATNNAELYKAITTKEDKW